MIANLQRNNYEYIQERFNKIIIDMNKLKENIKLAIPYAKIYCPKFKVIQSLIILFSEQVFFQRGMIMLEMLKGITIIMKYNIIL
jgi:hypothetical protein